MVVSRFESAALRVSRTLQKQAFPLGMAAAVALAFWAPAAGGGTRVPVDRIADAGIFVVFFLHGVGLSTEKLRAGIARWKVHLVVQGFTFGVFPLVWWGVRAAAGEALPRELSLGFLYLAALPSTISSSVALTAVARGNVAAAAFNASLSSLLGVFLTPLLVRAGGAAAGELPLGAAILDIAGLLLVPFVLGQLARPLVGAWFGRSRRATSVLDRGVILLLVYLSFSESVAAGLWGRYGLRAVALTVVGAGLLLALILAATRRTAALLRFDVEDEIATVFCGSKKTLASGVPMAKLIFGAHPGLGLIVLPIMFYHQLQLFVCSILAERYARRSLAPEPRAQPAAQE